MHVTATDDIIDAEVLLSLSGGRIHRSQRLLEDLIILRDFHYEPV